MNNNHFKGALPKDKNINRLPAQNLERCNSREGMGKTASPITTTTTIASNSKPATFNMHKLVNSNSAQKVHSEERDSNEGETSCSGNYANVADQLETAIIADDVSSGYELAPKPKVPCIPMFTENASIHAVRSFLIDESSGAEVVYKGRDIEDSSVSVLFVGSKSRIDLHSCKPVN